MAFGNLIVKKDPKGLMNRAEVNHPFDIFQREMSRWFDGFFNDADDFPFSLKRKGQNRDFLPNINIQEKDKTLEISAELPGMDEKDISVSLKDHVLKIRGEKKHEREEKSGRFHRMERRFGSFERSIHIPNEIEADKIKATYRKGVLKIVMPKAVKPEDKAKQIEVKDA